MIVFPESMNELDAEDTGVSIETLEEYIGYMRQRIEWAMGNVVKNVSAGNTSSAETYILLVALQNTVAALQSTVNSHSASINSILQSLTVLNGDLSNLEERVDAMGTTVTNLQATVNGLTTSIETLNSNYSALEARVAALENTNE